MTATVPTSRTASTSADWPPTASGPEPDADCPPTLAPGTRQRALRVTAEFDAARDQVQHARHFAEAMLRDWPIAADAAFVVSELAANAALHSASRDTGKFRVHLEALPGQYVWVEVRDEGGPWAPPGHPDDQMHGLAIIRELADDCGVDGDPHTGWIVWARLELPQPAAAGADAAVVPCEARPVSQPPTVNGHASAARANGPCACASRRELS